LLFVVDLLFYLEDHLKVENRRNILVIQHTGQTRYSSPQSTINVSNAFKAFAGDFSITSAMTTIIPFKHCLVLQLVLQFTPRILSQ